MSKHWGLGKHSACAITSDSEMANNFFQSKYGVSLDSSELLEAIGNAQGEMFNDESVVLSWNGINAMIAAELELDNYPVFYKTYESLEALKADGIEFYLEKFINASDSDRIHYG